MTPDRQCVVLVVDDEEAMEKYIQELLKQHDFEHTSFNDPVEALSFFEENFERVELIVSDIKMPGIDGVELARRAASIKPEIAVILLSGYNEVLPGAAVLPNVRAVLDKPLVRTDLIQAVGDILRNCRQGS